MKKEKTDKPKVSVLKNNLYFLGLVWNISKSRVIINFLIEIFGFAGWTYSSVIFMQLLFGEGIGSRSFSATVVIIWISVIIWVTNSAVMGWYYERYRQKSNLKLHYGLNTMLFKKVQTVDISCYESPEFYNTYTKAASEAAVRAPSVLDNCAVMFVSFGFVIYVVVTMALITAWSLLFIALPLVGNLYFGKKTGKINFDINKENTPYRRSADYVNRTIYFRKYAGEMRLTNIYNVLEKTFNKAIEDECNTSLKYAAKRAVLSSGKNLLQFLLGYQGMSVCGVILALAGDINLGQLMVLLNAIRSVSWMMNDFERSLTEVQTNAFFIDNIKEFLGFTPKIDESADGRDVPKTADTIEFKNVSFSYAGSDKKALNNVSLTMHRGTRHALVGINGSGKTTFIKLLMRFYDPTEGEILLNGINIKEFDIKKYRALIGAAFQDFSLFAATVAENVIMGEVDEQDKLKATDALKQSGGYAKISTLKNEVDTILTKEFCDDGVELSGGERQKIAIARSMVKNSPVIILDEPSSALDPIAEYEMFRSINRLMAGENTLSVIVSHRLSSAAMSDMLFVFQNGALIESGTHKSLIEKGGVYADMFLKQAAAYTASEEVHTLA